MSFVDPLGFSSYAISPAYPMQPMMEPAISPFGAFDPAMSSFSAFDPMSAFGAIDPMMSPFGSYSPAMSSYTAMQPQHYPPYPPRSPYGPMSSPYGDPSGGLSGMMGQLIQLFMSLFSSQNEPDIHVPDDPEIPDDPEVPDEPEVPVDNREQKIERLDPSESNTEALKILSIYSKDLGAKGGYLTKDALEDFIEYGAQEKGVPDKVKKAAEALKENEALYNLLCLDSESDPESGFALTSLNTQWEDDLEIDNLQASPSKTGKAIDTILEHKTLIGALNTSDTDANIITRDDLENLALGETEIPELSDSESRKLQAAALKLLSDEDTFEELDKAVYTPFSAGADTTAAATGDDIPESLKFTGTKNKQFTLTELAEWYERNDD
jgi:hypothetical protein